MNLPGARQAFIRTLRQVLLGLVTVVLAGTCLTSSANAADGPVSVTVTPADVVLTPGASASGVVVVANSGIAPVTKVHVKPQTADASITVKMATTDTSVPAGASIALPFTVKRSSEGTGQDVVVDFVVTYVQPTSSPSDQGTSAVVSTLNVKAAADLAIIDAKILSNIGAINENRPGEATLVITNPRETAVHVDAIRVIAPASVDVTLSCPAGQELAATGGMAVDSNQCSFSVGPRAIQLVHVTLKTTDVVTPGSRTVIIWIAATNPELHISSNIVANADFTVEVFGESDILKALGIPTFLLLPGVIIVVVAWFLISKLSPWRRVAGGVELPAWSAATTTAIVGLAVSLGIAAIYPTLTRRFIPGSERDYLKAYGFRDFYLVIFYSFVIALVVWVVAWLFSWLVYVYEWLLVPSLSDKPEDLLRKACLLGLLRGRTTFMGVSIAGRPGSGLNLGKRPGNKVLVAPVIGINLVGDQGDLATTIERYAASTREQDGFVTGRQNAFRLWQTIDRAVRAGRIKIAYRPGSVGRPQLVDSASVTDAQELPIVTVVAQG